MRAMESIVWALILLHLMTASAIAAPPHVMTWSIDGVKREALVFEPNAGASQEKRPLVFAFHGHGGNMRTFAKLAALETHWPQAIVVYPQALPTIGKIDPRSAQPGWQRLPGENQDRDVRFVDAMLATFRKENLADEQRTYATGFSNGATFALMLWAQRSDDFASFAIVGGALQPAQHLSAPKPVLQVTGSEDPLVPPTIAEKTIAEERRADGAGAPGQDCGSGCTLYRGKLATVKVIVQAGGHVYPTSAAEQTVEFFRVFGVPHPNVAATAQPSSSGAMPKAEVIQYRSHDGDLMGFVYKPPGAGRFPVYMWNHGSERDPTPAAFLAKFWLPHGFVLFVPLRAGHGPNPGKWIVDEQKQIREQRSPVGFQRLMELHERANDDVVAAYKWIARQSFVDPKRIVVAGGAFGAVQALLFSERDGSEMLGVRCVVAMSPASESWANPHWARRLAAAVDHTQVPVFLLQADNDYNLGPSQTLGPRIDAKKFPNRHKIFPAHGDPADHAQGYGGFFADPRAWGDDVLTFLHDCGAM